MTVRIKKLNIDSLDDISKLDVRFDTPWSKEWYESRMKKFPSLARGAYENEELVGFIVGKRMKSGINKISRVAVSEEHEGRGIGKELVKQFESRSRGKRVESRIRSSNKPSYHLHKSLGYDVDPSYKYTYKDKETGIKLFKRL